jgi:N-acetylglucosamine kinase-like BadF-type ATPase
VEALLRAHVLHQVAHQRFLDLCPLVFEAAVEGDPVAKGILVRQGLGLAEYITALTRRYRMQDLDFDVVLSGSVFKGEGTLLVDTLTRAIHQAAPRARIVRARFEPAVGSLLLAYDAASIPVTSAMLENLAASVPGDDFFKTRGG